MEKAFQIEGEEMQMQQNTGKHDVLGTIGSSPRLGMEIRGVGREPERRDSK